MFISFMYNLRISFQDINSAGNSYEFKETVSADREINKGIDEHEVFSLNQLSKIQLLIISSTW